MKKAIYIVVAVAALGLGAVCLMQIGEARKARQLAAAAQQALHEEAQNRQAQAEKVQALESERARLGKTVDQFEGLVHSLRGTPGQGASNRAALPGSATSATTGKDEPGGKTLMGALAKMMKDPSMQEFLRAQQKTMLQTMYGPMLKELNLTPEEKEKFMNLAGDFQMAAMEHGSAMFQEGGAGKAEAAKALKEKEAEVDGNVKALLGEERFAQYQDYKKTMADRMALDQFRQQMDGAAPLQDDQMKGLLQLIKEEREKVPPAIGDKSGMASADLAEQLTDENLHKQFQWQADLNQRVLGRAGQVLTQDQLKAYADYQARQLDMQKASVKMARELFGGGKPDAAAGNVPALPSR